MRILEFLLFCFVVISLMTCYAEIPGGHVLFSFACILLSGFYLLIASGLLRGSLVGRLHQAPHQERATIFIKAFAGVSFAFVTIGILFNEQLWTGRQLFIYIGILQLTVLVALSMLFRINDESQLTRYIHLRFWLMSCILLFYLTVPLHTRLEWKYEDQYYREILQFALENPDNEDAQKTVRDYKRRLEGLPIDTE